MKPQEKIEQLNDVARTYDMALSVISGTVNVALSAPDGLSKWESESILKAVLSTAAYYADLNRMILEGLSDE